VDDIALTAFTDKIDIVLNVFNTATTADYNLQLNTRLIIVLIF